MTKTIEAALLEREQLNTDFKALAKCLQDDNFSKDCNEPPLTELAHKRILIRMAVIDKGIKWLDKLIIDDITTEPGLVTIPTLITETTWKQSPKQ